MPSYNIIPKSAVRDARETHTHNILTANNCLICLIINRVYIVIVMTLHPNTMCLNTGDILLFHGDKNDKWYDLLIEGITQSPYEHAAIIIQDPSFPTYSRSGTHVMQADGPLDGTGTVRICSLDDALYGRTWVDVRCWEGVDYTEPGFQQGIQDFYNETIGKPYDYNCCDWFKAGITHLCKCCQCCRVPQKDNTFWCSALVGFGLVKMGLLPNVKTDWSNMAPSDLARLNVKKPYKLGAIERIM